MILINIVDLIPIIPDLINSFLSGSIFMYTYNWFNNKKIDTFIFTIWSLFISALIKSVYSALHIFILPDIKIHDSIKIIIFSLTGLLLAIICTSLKRTKLIDKLLYKVNNKSKYDDVFDEIIDYDKRTMMKIYLKSSDKHYIGRFYFREENGINSWISLVDYCSVDTEEKNKVFEPKSKGLYSSVIINLKEVERIEIVYEKDSEVWKRISGEEFDSINTKKDT